jgi:hypothetical protein
LFPGFEFYRREHAEAAVPVLSVVPECVLNAERALM